MPTISRMRWMGLVASLFAALLLVADLRPGAAESMVTANPTSPAEIQSVKMTVLSTMLVGRSRGIGEWGFAGLLEADGRRILIDTGAHPETVLQNARDLKIDLSSVKELIITHYHWDHVRGIMPLRKAMMQQNPEALSVMHVARGIFYSRPRRAGESNEMIAIRKEYEATGGKIVVHDHGVEIFPGAWLTGPVPRIYPERNWPSTGKVQTTEGLVEDTIPEDQSLVLNTSKGLVVVTGCGHAGIVNILTHAREHFPGRTVEAVIGGLHLYSATDEHLNWTADKLKEFKVANLVGAHCTGIEALYRLRERIGLTRKSALVGSVGGSYVLETGIVPGRLER